LVTKGAAGEIANTGVYRYSLIAPATEGIYIARAQCSSGSYSAFDVHTFHIALWANIIPDLNQYIWNYGSRSLTDYNQGLMFNYLEDINAVAYDLNGNAWLSAADVWDYSARSLTDYNMGSLPAYVWSYSSRALTDYNMSTLPDYLWVYNTRTLTDYNMSTLPAFVWSNPTRSLTTLGIEQDRNFVQSPDDGYLQKSSGMGGSYLNALVATPTVVSTQAYLYIGQRYDMIGETFYIWNSYLTFDTSAIGNDENILSATLNMKLNNDYSTANFDILSYSGDGSTCWGNGGLTAGDWNSCYYNGVYDGNLISTENLPSADNWVPMSLSAGAINKDGNTQFELTSSRYQSTSTSMGNEYVQFYSGNSAGNEPYLEIKTYNSDMNLYSIWYFAQRTLTD
jgi:hypothetical protein